MKQIIEKASKGPDLIPAKQPINTYKWKPKGNGIRIRDHMIFRIQAFQHNFSTAGNKPEVH